MYMAHSMLFGAFFAVAMLFVLLLAFVHSMLFGVFCAISTVYEFLGLFFLYTQLDILDEKSRIEVPYPYEMVFRLQKGRERQYEHY